MKHCLWCCWRIRFNGRSYLSTRLQFAIVVYSFLLARSASSKLYLDRPTSNHHLLAYTATYQESFVKKKQPNDVCLESTDRDRFVFCSQVLLASYLIVHIFVITKCIHSLVSQDTHNFGYSASWVGCTMGPCRKWFLC